MGELETLLYQALASPFGIVIRTNNFQLAQQRLYTARRNAMDLDLDKLSFRRSPSEPETDLWIIAPKSESQNAQE